MVKEWLENTKDCKIPSNLVPKCPVCGENMKMNLRKDANFVQDDNWYKQSKQYETFLDRLKDKNVVLLEISNKTISFDEDTNEVIEDLTA